MGRIVIWIAGIALFSLIYAATIYFKANDIENELKDRSNLALIKHNFSWATVSIAGRDATIEGTAPNIESIKRIEETIAAVWGIRMVKCRCQTGQENQPRVPLPSHKIQLKKKSESVDKNMDVSYQVDSERLLIEGSMKVKSITSATLTSRYSLLNNLIITNQHTDNIGKNNAFDPSPSKTVFDYFLLIGSIEARLKSTSFASG